MDGRRTGRREAPGNRIRLTGLLVPLTDLNCWNRRQDRFLGADAAQGWTIVICEDQRMAIPRTPVGPRGAFLADDRRARTPRPPWRAAEGRPDCGGGACPLPVAGSLLLDIATTGREPQPDTGSRGKVGS